MYFFILNREDSFDQNNSDLIDKSVTTTPPGMTEEHQTTMWLGTEDGHIHVYNCTDNVRIKKNKEKFIHAGISVLSMM